jgi:cell division protein FtsL
MIMRTLNKTAYIHVTRVSAKPPLSRFAVSMILVSLAALALITFSFVFSAHEDARGHYIDRLKREKQAVERNKALKMELAAVTQKSYVEFAAQERLGMKRPDDKEVVVVR